jgi:PAS domain S-box-containing protein
VAAAIDRIADLFLAVDTDSGRICDANPAAGALLGLARDALLEVDALSFVHPDDRAAWWEELDAISEGADPVRFELRLVDRGGSAARVACTATRFASRSRTLALVVGRPL